MKKFLVYLSSFFFFLASLLGIIEVSAQSQTIDSLKTLLKNSKEDTNKVNHLNNLSRQYNNNGIYDSALYYGNAALQCGQQIEFSKGIANSYNNIGNIYEYQSNYAFALENYFKSLKIREEIGDKKGIAASYSNIGNIYGDQGNYVLALENHFKSLKIAEEIGNKKGIASSYNNIGLIYVSQGNYGMALENYFKSLKIKKEIGDKRGIANSYNNIGDIYIYRKNFSLALENNLKSLKIKEEIGDKNGIANSYNNIGDIYYNKGNYDMALENHFKSLKIKQETGNKKGIVNSYNSIGAIYRKLKRPLLGIEYCSKALVLAKEIGSKDNIKDSYLNLYEAYAQMHDYKRAYEYHHLYSQYKDSILNTEITTQISNLQFKYQSEKEREIHILEKKKIEAEQKAALKHRTTIIYAILAGLILVIIFSVFLLNRFNVIRKQKVIIEEKNRDITDSIVYARRIQHALLASDSYLQKHLAKDYFVIFKPKDIVSGDFYWATSKGNKLYFAVCDSTGHGVPGAFMSLLNTSFLNEAINEKQIDKPGEIFNYVRKRLVQSISQAGAQDGMDGILVCFDKDSNSVSYAAANNAPLLIGKNELHSLDLDKMPIGKGEKQDSFNTYSIPFHHGNILYLYTDGYADQFGGPNGKKFKRKQLEENLLMISEKPMSEQKKILEETFGQWKGNFEQIDDVLVIGIRI